jgi:predicted dehydrogenase
MLESVAAEKKLVIEIAENYHYRPELEMVRKWAFEEKLIGEVVIIVAQNIIRLDTGTGFAATHWRIDNQYRGGIVMDGGIHYAAMFRRLGGEVEQVQAFSRQMHKSATSSIDTLSVNIRFRNGILGNLIFSGASPNPLPPREQPDCTIYGTNGLIQISKKNDARLLSQVADDGKKAELKETKYWAAEKSSYYLEFLNFYEAIRTGKPVIATPSECLKDLELLIAALDSAEERSVILL